MPSNKQNQLYIHHPVCSECGYETLALIQRSGGQVDLEQSLSLLALSPWDKPQPPWPLTRVQIIFNGAIGGHRVGELKASHWCTHISRWRLPSSAVSLSDSAESHTSRGIKQRRPECKTSSFDNPNYETQFFMPWIRQDVGNTPCCFSVCISVFYHIPKGFYWIQTQFLGTPLKNSELTLVMNPVRDDFYFIIVLSFIKSIQLTYCTLYGQMYLAKPVNY